MDNGSGVGVLDKAAVVLGALEAGPSTLAQLVAATGLARPTAHRLAVALEHHRLVARDMQGRFVLGPRLGELAASAGEDKLLVAANPVLGALRDHTNESAQLFRRQGEHRVCVSAAERPVGLRDSIPVGATLSMLAGSAAQVLLAWEEPDRLHRGLHGAAFSATMRSAICRGVPIRLVLKPSLYWMRSSNDDSAHMPLPSLVDAPASCTDCLKPSTAGRCAAHRRWAGPGPRSGAATCSFRKP